jgi:hypothetical protein
MLALRPLSATLGRQSESTATMTTRGGIVGRGGGLVIWEARL